MADPKTVTIVDTDFKSGFRIINESDFDASIHKVFDPTGKPAPKAKAPVAETADTKLVEAPEGEKKPDASTETKPEAPMAPAPRRRAAS